MGRLTLFAAGVIACVAPLPASGGPTPAARPRPATTTPKAVASKPAPERVKRPPPAPQQPASAGTRLSEPHEYELQAARVRTSFWQAFWQNLGSTLVALAWPATVVLIGLMARHAWDRYAQRSDEPAPTETEEDRVDAVRTNTAFTVPAAELAEMQDTAKQLVASFKDLVAAGMMTRVPPVLRMMTAGIPETSLGESTAIRERRERIGTYADGIRRVILARQLALATKCSTREATYGEALSTFREAQNDGYDADFDTWFGFLDRTGLLKNTTTGTSVSSVITPTELGQMVVSWCEWKDTTPNTLRRTPRGL